MRKAFGSSLQGAACLAELADKPPRRLSGPFKVKGHVRNFLQGPLNLAISVLWRAQLSTFNNMTSIIFSEKIRESKQTPATSLHEKGTQNTNKVIINIHGERKHWRVLECKCYIYCTAGAKLCFLYTAGGTDSLHTCQGHLQNLPTTPPDDPKIPDGSSF